MNNEKAVFFDGQAGEPWAEADYTDLETAKIKWLFERAGPRPGWRVFEPGCGTGRITRLLAREVGGDGLVFATDISRVMIERCRERTADMKNVTVRRAAFEELELEAESFNLVLCFNLFPHLDDKPRALAVFHRLLSPAGILAIFHLEASSFINDLHRKAGTVVQNDLLPERAEFADMIGKAGFRLREYVDDDRFFLYADKK